jgi:hypothetical protein
MRRVFLVIVVMLAAMMAPSSAALATIHPIVESIDCADASAFAHHPLGDVANPPGQTPGATPGNGDFKALSHASQSAFSDFKENGTCGNQP